MQIVLLTVGKTDVSWVREGLETYSTRLGHYVQFKLIEIPELKKLASLSKDQIKVKEGEIILQKLKPSDEVILLDERGKEWRSLDFAKEIENRLSRSSRDIIFVIGGAYGFSPEVYSRADGMMSLSKMTFPHQLVRTIFAEQLYRAFTIIRGEPYHHE